MKFFTILFICFSLSFFTDSGDSFASENFFNCSSDVDSYQQLIKIVEEAREKNSHLPQESKISDLRIFRKMCHFYYMDPSKDTSSGPAQHILINEKGEIVQWLSGDHSRENIFPCNGKEITRPQMNEYVIAARKKFPSIPDFVKGSSINFELIPDKECTYSYDETINSQPGQKDNGSSYHFLFDRNGDLFRFYIWSNEFALKLQSETQERIKEANKLLRKRNIEAKKQSLK